MRAARDLLLYSVLESWPLRSRFGVREANIKNNDLLARNSPHVRAAGG